MPDELVFAVSGNTAHPATPITLAEAGLREREHLQEWVLGNPEILGQGVMIITSEFDRWESRAGPEKDRLDILGLSTDGHLVIAELKRDAAPDVVEMQAIKYAAMASRFDQDLLADAYADFKRRHESQTLSNEEALEALSGHSEIGLNDETLRAPRILLIAGSFPKTVTATAVWLSEMGLDISLRRMQAYQTGQEVIVTVSQHYPPPEVEEFLVAPVRSRRARAAVEFPEIEWTEDDLRRLASEVRNVTIHATLDLCSAQPGQWIASEAVQASTHRETQKHRGDYGGFTITLHNRFSRSNPPFEAGWAVEGPNQMYYRVKPEIAKAWLALRGSAEFGDEEAELT